MPQRTIVLLGAGASFDAGLPLTSQLAERLVAKFNQGVPRQRGVQELNFVYSAMVGHQGEDGSDPLRAVNIETLISAVRLLQARESHEVAPFVSAWKAGALGFSATTRASRDYGRAARAAVSKALEDRHWGGDDLADLIAQIARDVGSQSNPTAFGALEASLLHAIRAELIDIETVDYLRPLAELAASQVGGLDIITLNYDLTVETMAAEAGTEIDRGIERWIPGVPFSFEQVAGRINLYKLHGSVDWELVDEQPRTVHPPKVEVVPTGNERELLSEDAPPRRRPGTPWIVVGDREKLATDGPTLDLLHAASVALNAADSLVAVGYSFADAHINAIVRNWMAADADRTLTVIDPAWPPFDHDEPRGHLAKAYGGSDAWGRPGDVPRIAVIADSAASSLARGLSTVPTRPEPYAAADWGMDPTAGEIVVRLHGPSLRNARVSGIRGTGSNINVLASAEERDALASRPLPRNSWRSAVLGDIVQDTEVSVFPVLQSDSDSVQLTLEGHDLVGMRLIRLELPPIPSGTPRVESQ